MSSISCFLEFFEKLRFFNQNKVLGTFVKLIWLFLLNEFEISFNRDEEKKKCSE